MRLTFDRLRATERHPAPQADCLDELGLAAAADGRAAARDIEHLSRCAACRSHVAHLSRLLADESVAREIHRIEGKSRGRWASLRGSVGVAAAAVLVVAVVQIFPRTDSPGFRDPSGAAATVPALAAPLAENGRLESLRWSGVDGATQYRVTVFDEEGGLVWASETVDTAIAFPPDTTLVPGMPYWWRVEARVDFDRWSASELGMFTLDRR